MTHNPYDVEPRRPLTPKQKLQMFLRHEGRCCICGGKINSVHEAWDEHVNPLWLAGSNDAENRAPAHVKCARAKTAGEAKQRAAGRRKAEKHQGAGKKTKGAPMPGSRKSKWKRKMSGEIVLRDKD